VKRQIALIAIVLIIGSVGFFGSRATGGGGGCFEPVSTQRGSDIDIKDFCFSPTVALVDVGDTVTWTNRDSIKHNVGLANTVWASRDMSRNDAVSYRFDKAGVFPYVCYVHPGMSGALVVGDPQVGAMRRMAVGRQMGYMETADAGDKSDDGGTAQAGDTKLQSDDADPAASRDGSAFYVFLILVGVLLMVALIFLALNPRRQPGEPEDRLPR
jgi:plastocyanin